MKGLPTGACECCGLVHDPGAACPMLATLGEDLVVAYRRAKREILAGRRTAASLSAEEMAGLWITVAGLDGAVALGASYPKQREAQALVRRAQGRF